MSVTRPHECVLKGLKDERYQEELRWSNKFYIHIMVLCKGGSNPT